ncbi:MAG: Uma2 family endonuclease [Chloroflexota bacterium]
MTGILNPPVQAVESLENERWTHDDFMLLAPADQKAELIDGEMFMAPPAFEEHERLQSFLMTVLQMYVSRYDLGEVRGSRTAVYISDTQTYEPDLLFVRRERAHIITHQKLVEAPDLIIEILSAATARYDRGVKLGNYARAGTKEVWLIDPYGAAGTQFFQRQQSDLIQVAPLDGVIYSVAIPGLKFKIAWLWPGQDGKMANPVNVLREMGVI